MCHRCIEQHELCYFQYSISNNKETCRFSLRLDILCLQSTLIMSCRYCKKAQGFSSEVKRCRLLGILKIPTSCSKALAPRKLHHKTQTHCACQWGVCEYVIVQTILGGSPVILWISLGGKPKWLQLKFG